jgi:hypothetical protein
MPIARASAVERGLGRAMASVAVRLTGDVARAERARGHRHVELVPRARGDDAHDVSRHGEVGVHGRIADPLGKSAEVRVGARAADGKASAPVAWEREQLGDPRARDAPAPSVAAQEDGPRDRKASPASRTREHGSSYVRPLRADRERHRPRTPLERGERPDDDLGGCIPIEATSRTLRDELDAEPPPDESSVPRRALDSHGDPLEGVLEGGVGHGERRKDLRAEESRMEAPEAPKRPESVARTSGCRHRRAPVGLDTELLRRVRKRRPGGDERRGLVRHVAVLLRELRDGIGLGQPADVDTRNAGALGELGGRAGESEADEHCDQQEDPRAKSEGEGRRATAAAPTHTGRKEGRLGAHERADSTDGRPGKPRLRVLLRA